MKQNVVHYKNSVRKNWKCVENYKKTITFNKTTKKPVIYFLCSYLQNKKISSPLKKYNEKEI